MRTLNISLAVSVALAVVLAAGCKDKTAAPAKPPPPPPREVEVLTVVPAEARVTGEYLGSLLSRASLTVLPQVNGYVRKIHIKPGQTVADANAALQGVQNQIRDATMPQDWSADDRVSYLKDPMAFVPAASGLSVGGLRADDYWNRRLQRAVAEACAVAEADGIPLRPAAQWDIIEQMADETTTSAARDVAAGRRSELDLRPGGRVLRPDARSPSAADRGHGLAAGRTAGVGRQSQRLPEPITPDPPVER